MGKGYAQVLLVLLAIVLIVPKYLEANHDSCISPVCGRCCRDDTVPCCNLDAFCGVFSGHRLCQGRSTTLSADISNILNDNVEGKSEDDPEVLLSNALTGDPSDEEIGTLSGKTQFSKFLRILKAWKKSLSSPPITCSYNCHGKEVRNLRGKTKKVCNCGSSAPILHKLNILTMNGRRCATVRDMYSMNDQNRALSQILTAVGWCRSQYSRCKCMSNSLIRRHYFARTKFRI